MIQKQLGEALTDIKGKSFHSVLVKLMLTISKICQDSRDQSTVICLGDEKYIPEVPFYSQS